MSQQSQQKHRTWARHIEAQRQSSLSQQAYCELHALKPHQFWYWKRKLVGGLTKHEPGDRQQSTPSAFIPVSVASATATDGLSLHFPGGVHLAGITEHNTHIVQQLVGCLR